MRKRISWFCCDSSIHRDPRVASLPDNDYRWAYLTLMALEKTGELEGQEILDFHFACMVSAEKFAEIIETLQKKQLIDEDGRPVGFDEWQEAALRGERVRRHREKKRECNGNETVVKRTCNGDETPCNGDETTETETDTETDKKNRSAKSAKPASAPPPEAVDLASHLAQRIADNDPKAKIPKNRKQADRWIDAIDKLNRIDGRSWATIRSVIDWCQDSDFWRANILSGPKLREKFPTLVLQMQRDGPGADLERGNIRAMNEYLNRVGGEN